MGTLAAVGAMVGAGGAHAALTSDPNITAVFASGHDVDYTSPPTFDPVGDPKYLYAIRQGFDASGAAVNFTDELIVTQRVRKAYPNHASLTTSKAALSDYVYSTDTITGVTNNSAETSPKPIANWVSPHRAVVGNSISVEVVAGHRNARDGEQVACVVFRATDGTTTVTTTVSATTISGRAGDKNPVIVHAATLDITSLAAGLITVNAKVYPWVGGAASVLDSADQTAAREFSPRYFLKNTTLAASPPYAYVATTGNDGTGVISTTAATAKATPFLTVLGAINALHTAYSATTGVDGCIIRVGAGTFVLGSTAATRTQKAGYLTIERDPDVARADAIVSFGVAAFRPRLGASGSYLGSLTTGCIRFHDISILRTGAQTLQGEATAQLEMIFDDINYDNASYANALLSNSHGLIYGATITNMAGSVVSPNATLDWRCFRGLSVNMGSTNIEGWLIVGSNITAPGVLARNTKTQSGAIYAFNKFLSITNTNSPLNLALTENVTGALVLQNVWEYISASTASLARVSGEGDAGDTSHVVMAHNTFVGFYDNGSAKLFNNDTTADHRTNKLMRMAGNIHVQLNTRHDVFKTDGTFIESWSYLYGVGCTAEFSMYLSSNNGGANNTPAFHGMQADIGTSATVRNDPLFTDYQGTTSGPTAGAGGGTYTLEAGSPADGLLIIPVLKFDLAGTPRAASNTAAGAYEL